MMATETPRRRGLFGLIGSDLKAKSAWMYQSESGGALLKTLLADGTITMIFYRLMQASQRYHLSPVAMLFNRLNSIFGQCVIGRGAEFGPGFVILYSNGIVINSLVRGGSHVTITHQNTIGEIEHRAPVLGDHVYVGAGARILGAVTVGSHTKIGANAVVVNDVPDGATVVGIPARIARQRTPDAGPTASGFRDPQ
jgi:serine O-acetyltransferase